MNPQAAPKRDREGRVEAILDVAQEVFLEQGFANASMSEIAARLGGSKATLYNYFKSKDELFEAFVQRRCFWQGEQIFGPLTDDGDVGAELSRLGHAYIRHILSDDSMRTLRLIMAEAERWPEIGRLFYECGPRRGVERLGGVLRAWAAEGKLRIDDPAGAALMFMALCKDRWFVMRLCNVVPELEDGAIEAQVRHAVGVFLQTYAIARR